MLISFIICTYAREAHFKKLVASIRDEFQGIEYEIVAVMSDAADSEKALWAGAQHDVRAIVLADRPSESRSRSKSLYYYENIGIRESLGDWILITNDDTTVDKGTASSFMESKDYADVIVVPAHIDDPNLGKRAPILGSVIGPDMEQDVYLLDFAFIRSSVFRAIGPMDEKLDWYGAGLDRGLSCALLNGCRQVVLKNGGLSHDLAYENRNPPHASFDFEYLKNKWDEFFRDNPSYQLSLVSPLGQSRLPVWYRRLVAPRISAFVRFARKNLRTPRG